MPDSMTFEEGATMSAVYCTAIYCLMDAARLSKGQVRTPTETSQSRTTLTVRMQSVLIHSATGGVGIAALQIARMIGAEVRSIL
jgi:NADPH:quinone reductase-like Zn-dependent oxidoreductase